MSVEQVTFGSHLPQTIHDQLIQRLLILFMVRDGRQIMNGIVRTAIEGNVKEYYEFGFLDMDDLDENLEDVMRLVHPSDQRIIINDLMKRYLDNMMMRALSCCSPSLTFNKPYVVQDFDEKYMDLLYSGMIKINTNAVISMTDEAIRKLEGEYVMDISPSILHAYMINRRLGHNLLYVITDDTPLELALQMYYDGVRLLLRQELKSIYVLENIYHDHGIRLTDNVMYSITNPDHLISYIKMGYTPGRDYTIYHCGSYEKFMLCKDWIDKKSIVLNMIKYYNSSMDDTMTIHISSDRELENYSVLTQLHHHCRPKFSNNLNRLDIIYDIGYNIKLLNIRDVDIKMKKLIIRDDIVLDSSMFFIGLSRLWKKYNEEPSILAYYMRHHKNIIHLLHPRIHDKFSGHISYKYPTMIKNSESISDINITTMI